MSPTISSIAFDPLLPWEALYALGGLAIVVVLLALSARAKGALWRALVLATLWLALANPILVEEDRRFQTDIALLAIDLSESQNVGDRQKQIGDAHAALIKRFAKLDRVEVREITLPPATATSDARGGTRLFEAVTGALADIPRERLAGVILLTDGQVHDVPDVLPPQLGGAPIHTLLTGKKGEFDRRLVIEQAPRFGVVGKSVQLKLRVEDEALRPGTLVPLEIVVGAKPADRRQVRVGASNTIELDVPLAGDNVVEVTVPPGTQELTLENNRAMFTINGIRDRLRVLLVSGEPYPGERAWRNLLKSDPAVDMVHFTILRTPAKDDFTPVRELSLIVFPMQELFDAKLKEFNLIIFDRYEHGNIITSEYFRNIARYVQQGGALLVNVGPIYATSRSLFRTPLGAVLPAQPTGKVLETGYRPGLTDSGQRHPITAGLTGSGGGLKPTDATWGRWFRMVTSNVGQGEILMRGAESQPLLVVNRIGEGRVGQIMSDHLWLWNRGIDGGGPQAELVRRVAHWLMKEPELEEESMRAVVSGGRIEITRQTLKQNFEPITMVGPDGKIRLLAPQAIAPGRGLATIAVDKPGIYRFDDGAKQAVAAVGSANPLEFADVRATDSKLRKTAEDSGGAIVWLSDTTDPELRQLRPGRAMGGRDWFGMRRNEAYSVAGVSQYPLLPGIALAFLLLVGLGLAWYREGR